MASLHVDSRRVICVVEQAQSMLQNADQMELPVRYLVRDLDFKYSKRFKEVFERADVAVEPTAPRAPN
jgi:putative transposase